MLTAIFSHAADTSGLKADWARGDSSLSPSPKNSGLKADWEAKTRFR
jgi:hypothetical protein